MTIEFVISKILLELLPIKKYKSFRPTLIVFLVSISFKGLVLVCSSLLNFDQKRKACSLKCRQMLWRFIVAQFHSDSFSSFYDLHVNTYFYAWSIFICKYKFQLKVLCFHQVKLRNRFDIEVKCRHEFNIC